MLRACVCVRVRFISLTIVFLFEEGPQLVGSLLRRVLVLGELALLFLRDQLKYRLETYTTSTNVYNSMIICLCVSFALLAFFV